MGDLTTDHKTVAKSLNMNIQNLNYYIHNLERNLNFNKGMVH
jgi:hypothetical protein